MIPRTILVVDDDREWNFLVKLKLELAGFRVEQAFNGKQAMEKIQTSRPDLVLLDITMPLLDGWEVCRLLRSVPTTHDLPIVVVSSFSSAQDVQKGKSFQVQRYLFKPCPMKAIVENVHEVLNAKGEPKPKP